MESVVSVLESKLPVLTSNNSLSVSSGSARSGSLDVLVLGPGFSAILARSIYYIDDRFN